MVHETARRVVVVLATVAMLGVAVLLAPSAASSAVQPVGSKPAIFDGATWYLRSSLSSGPATSTFRYGQGGDIAVMGDWDGDGDETVGVVRMVLDSDGNFRYVWYLRDSNSAGSATVTPFVYGRVTFVAVDQLGTIPLVGDWDGDGDDTPAVMFYSPELDGSMQWHVRNSATGGPADLVVPYSTGRDLPVVGDWDGDGDDSIGVVRRDTWLLRNSVAGGNADLAFGYGSPSFLELPVVGDWDGNGTDTPAVLRNNPPTEEQGGFETWLFRNSNSAGPADGQITFGSDAQEVGLPFDVVPRLSFM